MDEYKESLKSTRATGSRPAIPNPRLIIPKCELEFIISTALREIQGIYRLAACVQCAVSV